jgi:hypothetical protein
MSSNPETSDQNSSSSSSSEEDVPPYPWGLENSDYEREMERRWDVQERQWNVHRKGEPSHVPNTAERELVSPFICTSDEESSEEENEDPTFLPPSTPERSQPRSSKRDPSLPTSPNLVLDLPAPEPGLLHQEHIGQSKKAEIIRKGKEKLK